MKGQFVSLPGGRAEWIPNMQDRRGPPLKATPDPTGRREYMRRYMARRRAAKRASNGVGYRLAELTT